MMEKFFERLLQDSHCWGFVHLELPGFPLVIQGACSEEEACELLKRYVERSLKKEFHREDFLIIKKTEVE